MKKLFIFYFFIIGFTNCLRSQSIVIAGEESRLAIPFCSVYILNNSNQLLYSDSKGRINLSSNTTDSIFLEHTSFQSKKLKLNRNIDTIFLAKKIYKLPNVTVPVFNKEVKLGILNYKKFDYFPHWHSTEFIRKIDLSEVKGYYKIKQIYIPIKFNEIYADSCRCKVHLYKLDSNQVPSDDILTKPIILSYGNLPSKYTIELEDEHIVSDEKTLYIGLECFIPHKARQNEHYLKWKDSTYKRPPEFFNSCAIKLLHNSSIANKDLEQGLTYQRVKLDAIKQKYSISSPLMFTAGLVILTQP